MNRKAIIVGGGIGGLTAAICLRQIGWDVQVFETAPSNSEIGAGIQISPNGVRILQEIGSDPDEGYRSRQVGRKICSNPSCGLNCRTKYQASPIITKLHRNR